MTGYSSESTKRELSNEYQHDRVKMVFKNLCTLVLWTKVASALEGLKNSQHQKGIKLSHLYKRVVAPIMTQNRQKRPYSARHLAPWSNASGYKSSPSVTACKLQTQREVYLGLTSVVLINRLIGDYTFLLPILMISPNF